MLRRLFIRRIAEGLIGFAGVSLVLRWVETGLVDNTGATAAARTFNQAIVDHRNGRDHLEAARSAAARKAWPEAKVKYREAHNDYYQAAGTYEDARNVAKEANCDAVAQIAEKYMRFCRKVDTACSLWNDAARLNEEGKPQKASKKRARADAIFQTAIESVDIRIPEQRNEQNPIC